MTSVNVFHFQGKEIELIEHNGKPYVAMKTIVQNIGPDWKSQERKLKQRVNSVMVILTITAKDGKNYKTLCLPLDKLTAWLFTIHANKVKPEIRPLILRYQAESEAVLFRYWTLGVVRQSKIRAEMQQLQQEESASFAKGSEAGKGLYIRKLEKQRNEAIYNSLQMQLDFISHEIQAA